MNPISKQIEEILGEKITSTYKTYKEIKAALPIQPGDHVLIEKGTPIQTTHPKGNYTALATYVVKVHNVSVGYGRSDFLQNESRPPEVTWVGTGSYWFWTDMNNVKKVTPNEKI